MFLRFGETVRQGLRGHRLFWAWSTRVVSPVIRLVLLPSHRHWVATLVGSMAETDMLSYICSGSFRRG
jgi:hypothetical protein